MAAELPRPGVEVIQVFRTVTPTVVSPTLVPCVVGVCKQIVDVLTTDATGASQINAEALIDLPGFFEAKAATGSPLAYTTLDGLKLVLSITEGPDVPIEFKGNSFSPASAAAQINDAFAAQGVTEAIAEVSLDGTFFRVRTIGVDEFSDIAIRPSPSPADDAVLAAFGLIAGYVFKGTSAYSQYIETVPLLSFPDPRSNLDQLVIEADSVRVFFGMGSGANLHEVSQTTTYLRQGSGGSKASITGSVDITGTGLTYPLAASTLSVTLDGGTAIVATLTGAADEVELIRKINTALGGMYASQVGVNAVITSKTKGANSSVLISGTGVSLGFAATKVSGTAGVVVSDDGNGDSVSPLLDFYGQNFTTVAGPATLSGLVDMTTLTLPADLAGKTLTLAVSGKRPQTFTFSTEANGPAVATAVQNFWPELTANGTSVLALTTVDDGEDATIQVLGGTAAGVLGLVPSVTGSIDVTTIAAQDTTLNGKKLKFNLNGVAAEVTIAGLPASAGVAANIATALNSDGSPGGLLFQANAKAEAFGNKVRVRLKASTGALTFIKPMTASSADAAFILGFDTSDPVTYLPVAKGSGMLPVSGDDLYVDGTPVGRITAVAPGPVVTRLRVNKQLTINTAFGELFYIVAKNLLPAVSGRPLPDLSVTSEGVPTIKANVLRDSSGNPTASKAPAYLAYHAVREDVSPMATTPSLLRFDSTTQLESILSPVNALNPLALGLYFALLNAPGAQVSGLGVDAIDASYPYGTIEAFTRAATALEAYEVYAIAPLTHDESVAQVFNAHVTAMSDPTSKGERICLFNFNQPTQKTDTLIASGLLGNTIGGTGLVFDTGIPNLSSLILAKGIDPVGTIPASSGLFLFVANSTEHYSVESISGGVVTLRTTFVAGENDDLYYAVTALSGTLIDEPFSIKVRGATLTLPSSSLPDKTGISETYQTLAQSYANRRFWNIVPDKVAATISGLEQVLEGFYASAAIAGMIAQQPPQQSFTNFPMTGFTRVIGSNDYFTEKQLNVMAAGGNYIIVQDSAGAPLIARMALTTDMTSLETRTDSITKIVDFTAKFMRQGLRAYIGRFNITQGFLDSLGHVCQGLLGFLTDIGVLIGANLNNIVQDESSPDTVLIDVTLDVPFPCNYIRLTLVI